MPDHIGAWTAGLNRAWRPVDMVTGTEAKRRSKPCSISSLIGKGDVLIEMEALGRPLYPGSMYDCRTESFIPGFALWDEEALHEHRQVRQQYETDLKVSSFNSFSEKASLLNMSTSLRASFWGGMLGDGGYARYLMDSKSSARQSRVTLRYSQIRRFEELTLTELGNITYTYAFQHKLATHMITAVLYGAQCFMVFSYTASDDEDQQEVERNLLTMVKKIPSFTIERDGSVSLNENETKMAKKIRFALYGDFSLRRIPITFTDVVTLYKELPSLMTDDDAVPVRVWLYPLMLLDDRAAKLEREISASLVSKVGHLLEELVDIQRRCNDLITIRSRNDFRDVKQRLQKFKHLPHYYMLEFQTALQKALRAIRGGEQEEQVLIDILNTHYSSPFTAYNLNKWLDNIATEINILSSYTRELKDTPVVTSSIIPFVADIVVCLSFTSLRYEDKYLETLNDFQFSAALGQTNHTTNISQQLEPWFTGDVLKNMDRTLSRFTSFLKANKNRKGIGFITAAFPDPNNPGASIQLYKQGRLVNPNFEPVSRYVVTRMRNESLDS
uniref:SNTX thioredoxin-like domain-containing protein n=1 Tax=Electrophorus electricus TaxID=8005 RepID=A0A4W4FU37_ELEEL